MGQTADSRQRTAARVSTFEYVMLRAAAAPFGQLDSLRAEESLHLVRALAAEIAAIDDEYRAVGDALFAAIGDETDLGMRRALVEVRRTLFKRKRPNLALLGSHELAPRVLALLERVAAFEEREREAAASFDAELTKLRLRLADIASQPIVQRGLALSSRNLLASFENFYRRRVGGALNSKDLDVELGITKYVSRIHTKPSPFSTFTNIACAKLTDEPRDLSLSDTTPAVTQRVHVNHLVLRFLRRAFLADAELRVTVPLAINSSLTRADGQYLFFTNSNNVEVFQRLNVHPLIDVILDAVAAGSPSHREAIDALIDTGMLDMSREEIAGVLDELIAFGILEYDIPVSGLDFGWIAKFRAFVAARGANTTAAAIVQALDTMAGAAAQFGDADAGERQQIIDRAGAALDFASDEKASRFVVVDEEGSFRRSDAIFSTPPPHLLYEDSLLECQPLLPRAELEPLAAKLQAYVDHIDRFDTFASRRLRARDLLDERFGGAPVSLMRFFEEHCRVRNAAAPEPAFVKLERPIDARWMDEMLRRSAPRRSNDVIDIAESDLAAATALAPPAMTQPPSMSQCSFVQLFRDGDGLTAVTNGFLPGFGKGVSRLLHLFDDCTAALRARNERMDAEAMLAVATDSSCWNSNIHPPLMPYSIRIPGGERAVSVPEISIADLDVCADEHDLALMHRPSGRRVYVFDIGLQAAYERSDLYQFLTRFALTTFSPAMMLPDTLANRCNRSDGELTVQPRITYERQIVLRRKSWLVERDAIPRRARGESSWSHFRRLDEWRTRNALPDRVFVTARPRTENKSKAAEPARDDRKPQYVDFTNPFLAAVLDNLLGRAVERIELVEMLPSPDDLLTIGGRRYATEFVLQWYSGAQFGQ